MHLPIASPKFTCSFGCHMKQALTVPFMLMSFAALSALHHTHTHTHTHTHIPPPHSCTLQLLALQCGGKGHDGTAPRCAPEVCGGDRKRAHLCMCVHVCVCVCVRVIRPHKLFHLFHFSILTNLLLTGPSTQRRCVFSRCSWMSLCAAGLTR